MVFSWIKDQYEKLDNYLKSNQEEVEKQKKDFHNYYWVSEKHRQECNKIIENAWRDGEGWTLPWDEWHSCMKEADRPIETYKFYQDYQTIISWIKRITGTDRIEKSRKKDIPPKKRKPKRKDPEDRDRDKDRDKEKERDRKRKPRKKRKTYKPPKQKIKDLYKRKKTISPKSSLNISFFSTRLNLNARIKPELLDNFTNIDQKVLNIIENN